MARLLDGAEIVCESRALPKRLESALANLEKKIKECLTNHQKCDIIKIQMRDARRPKDGVPTRASKTSTIKSSTARSLRCAEYKCEPIPRLYQGLGGVKAIYMGEYRESANSAVCKTVPLTRVVGSAPTSPTKKHLTIGQPYDILKAERSQMPMIV